MSRLALVLLALVASGCGSRPPDLFVRGERLYTANLNPGHPAGTIQSIEHTLRSLERMGEEERERCDG